MKVKFYLAAVMAVAYFSQSLTAVHIDHDPTNSNYADSTQSLTQTKSQTQAQYIDMIMGIINDFIKQMLPLERVQQTKMNGNKIRLHEGNKIGTQHGAKVSGSN